MTSPQNPRTDAPTPQSAHQLAVQRSRPRWQGLALMLGGLFASFIIPGIALCGWLPLPQIVWAIALTTLATGLGYWAAGWLLERRSAENARVDDFLISGTLLIGAALLWAQAAMHPGPIRGNIFEFWPTAATAALILCASVVTTQWRAKRLALLGGDCPGEED